MDRRERISRANDFALLAQLVSTAGVALLTAVSYFEARILKSKDQQPQPALQPSSNDAARITSFTASN